MVTSAVCYDFLGQLCVCVCVCFGGSHYIFTILPILPVLQSLITFMAARCILEKNYSMTSVTHESQENIITMSAEFQIHYTEISLSLKCNTGFKF